MIHRAINARLTQMDPDLLANPVLDVTGTSGLFPDGHFEVEPPDLAFTSRIPACNAPRLRIGPLYWTRLGLAFYRLERDQPQQFGRCSFLLFKAPQYNHDHVRHVKYFPVIGK
jgi:hypothetical protein